MMPPPTKEKLLARLRRIAGQVEGIARMVEADRYCMDVLFQIEAAQAALGQAGNLLLRSHVETCVADAMASGKGRDRTQKTNELMELFTRYGGMTRR